MMPQLSNHDTRILLNIIDHNTQQNNSTTHVPYSANFDGGKV